MSSKMRKIYILSILAGALLIFASLNIIFRFSAEHISIDMTKDKRFSLSEYSKEQIKKIDYPIYITVYYSSEIANENPIYGRYAEFVFKFLKQYQKLNPNKIMIAIKDPIPYSAIEKEAKKKGILAFPSTSGNINLYFGAVFSNGDKKEHVISNISKKRDFWLEKDITFAFSKILETQRKSVGLISPVHKMQGNHYDSYSSAYAITHELSERYDIIELPTHIKEIPTDIDTLILVAPRKLPYSLSYALDQFVLRGGKLIMFLDMIVENPEYTTPNDTLTDINNLMKNWGLSLSKKGIGSIKYGKKIYLKEDSGEIKHTPYPLWLELPAETINQQSHLMSGIKNLRMINPTEIVELEHSKEINVTPLIKIEGGAEYQKHQLSDSRSSIIANYVQDNKSHMLGALSEGKFYSYFVNAPELIQEDVSSHLLYSIMPSQVVVFGDSDMLRDDVWLDSELLNDNGQALMRIIDILKGNEASAVLYKPQQQATQDSIGKSMYSKIAIEYAEQANKMLNELDALKDEYDSIRMHVNSGKKNMDAYTSSKINKINSKVQEIEKTLQQYEYNVKQSFHYKKQSIIWVNIILIPLIILLLWVGLYQLYTYRKTRQIEDKYNAH